MDKPDENRRYKWSTPATNLLVSIWSHDMVQNRLKLSSRNQPIWESIARYMTRKGFNVTGIQCRTRIKNMLCSYYEAARKNDQSYIEPYFDLFKKVMSNRNPKKKGRDRKTSKHRNNYNEVDDDYDNDRDVDISSDTSVKAEEESGSQNSSTDPVFSVDYLDANNQEVQVTSPCLDSETLLNLEKIITNGLEAQAKIISEAMRVQSEIVEKLLASEREKLEAILLAEKESRMHLEERLDRIIAKLE